jgi:hypothetical protein
MNGELSNYHILFEEPLNIDYAKEAERWVDLIIQYLKEHDQTISGHSLMSVAPTTCMPYFRWQLTINVTDGQARQQEANLPRVLIVPGSTSTDIHILLGANRPILRSEISLWMDVINKATTDLQSTQPRLFTWEAAIGQLRENGRHQRYSLRSKSVVGDLTLRPGRILYMWPDSSATPRFGDSTFNYSFPIIIEGAASGIDWREASRQASRDLNKLVALISVAWQSTWKVIQSPTPKQEGLSLQIPSAMPGTPNMLASLLHIPRMRRTIPGWLPNAYAKLDASEAVNDALHVYHEGLLMELEHPSFALLASVASIEAIGRKLLGKRSPNKRRFVAGLRTVIRSKERVNEIANAYVARSDTVHEAKLHGNENLFGYLAMPSIFNPDPSDMFWLTHVPRLRHVAQRVLTKQLKQL